MTAAQHVVLVEQSPDGQDKCEIVCTPFEPNFSGYAGEIFLGIYWDGEEEAFAVLTPEQAARLAALLTGEAQ